MENAKIDSPRGTWTMSKAHNPIQDIYLRKVVGRENRFVSVAHKALADPARGCKYSGVNAAFQSFQRFQPFQSFGDCMNSVPLCLTIGTT